MKFITCLFLFSCFLTLHAQDQNEDLKSANKEIYLLTDSLWNLEKLYVNKSIDEKSYLKNSGELLNAISALAFSNASNYTRMNEPNISEVNGQIITQEPTPVPPQPKIVQDTVPKEQPMEDFKDYTPPRNPINLITGSGRRTTFKLRYGMFWNGLSQSSTQSGITYPKFKVWSSYCWFGEFDILLQTRLGKSNRGPWSLYYGIGWDYRKLTQKENVQQLTLKNDKAEFYTVEKVDKASLNLHYFRIPVGLQFKPNKLAINVGGYVGFITNHEQILEYTTSLDEKAELTLDKNYNFQKTIYGLSASIGYKHIHIGFNYDLSTLFKDNDQYKYNAWKIGLMIF